MAQQHQDHVGDCQNYGPLLGPYYNTGPNSGPNLGDPKRDHNFDNPPCELYSKLLVRPFDNPFDNPYRTPYMTPSKDLLIKTLSETCLRHGKLLSEAEPKIPNSKSPCHYPSEFPFDTLAFFICIFFSLPSYRNFHIHPLRLQNRPKCSAQFPADALVCHTTLHELL